MVNATWPAASGEAATAHSSVILRQCHHPTGTYRPSAASAAISRNLAGEQHGYKCLGTSGLTSQRGLVKERNAENQIAMPTHANARSRVAAEVAQHIQLTRSATRAKIADRRLKEATETVKTNLAGRPDPAGRRDARAVFARKEVVAAIQAQSGLSGLLRHRGGSEHAQFRLYRAPAIRPIAFWLVRRRRTSSPSARLALPTPITPSAPCFQ